MIEYTKGQVRSADGTTIGYRELGHGPALILMHGGMLASQHFMRLAEALGDLYRLCVPDRRGRGLSGPHGPNYCVQREVEDLRALIAATGARRVFGLSSGGLVTLRTALVTPELEEIALYEPPLSVGRSVPTAWLARYDEEVAAGKTTSALVSVMKGLGGDPVFGRIPRAVLVPLLSAGSRAQRRLPEDDVSVADLVPTEHFDMLLVDELADTLADYAEVKARVLLFGGTKSESYLHYSLERLATVLPDARSLMLPGVGHSAPDDDPLVVASALREFFTR